MMEASEKGEAEDILGMERAGVRGEDNVWRQARV